MSWLLWRQHRACMLVVTAALGLFAVAVLLTGVHMAHVYNDAVRSCGGDGHCDLLGDLFRGYGAIIDLVHLSGAVPILLGVFLGATLIARETEHATNALVWTQTVTRRRWLYSKIAAALVATLIISAAVTALVTWWSGTPNALDGNRFEGAQFDTQNIAPIAFALFAVALGIAAGSLFRRILPAIAATVGSYVATRLVVAVYLRPHYMKAITHSFPAGADVSLPSGSWTLSRSIVDSTGHAANGPIAIPNTCRAAADRAGVQNCLDRLGFHEIIRFHPASHYWRFQWIEAGLFIVLAVALVAFALIHTMRHDA